MHGSSYDKYVWLIDIFERKGSMTFAEIAEEWLKASINYEEEPLALRTFNRWKQKIYDQFGMKLVCNRSTNKYSIENAHGLKNGDVRKWLFDALTVTNMLNERDALEGRILLENIPSGREYMQPILDAMKDNRKMEVTYKDFADDEPYTVTYAPYFVKLFQRRWNVIGKVDGSKELTRFSLDRIRDVKILDSTFSMPKGFDASAYLANCYGVAFYTFTGEVVEPTRVVFRVDYAQRDYVRTLKVHPSQKEIVTTDYYSDFEVFVRPTYDFLQFILSLNFRTQIIEPFDLRLMMAEIVYEMARNYMDCYDDSCLWDRQLPIE